MQGGVRRPSCPICNWDIEINREELALALGMYHIASNDHKGQASQQSNVTITDEDEVEIMRSMGLIEEDEVIVTAEQTKQVNTEDHETSPIDQDNTEDCGTSSIDQDNTNEITDSITSTLKRPNPLASSNSQSTKKVKKSDEKKDESKTRNGVSSNVAKKLIEELSTETSQISEVSEENTGNFHDLYLAINRAEEQSERVNQLVIKTYYDFGKALEDRYDHYKKSNPKRTAQALVNKEVRQQLPSSVSETLLRKRKERAQKIYDLFSEIGESMIQRVKSFTASSISKMSQDDIDAILVYFSQHQDTSKHQKP